MKVEDIMKPRKSNIIPDIFVSQGENIDNAALLMREHDLKSIEVMGDAGKIVGIVTRRILINHSDDINENFFID